jgi:hypothetical protein
VQLIVVTTCTARKTVEPCKALYCRDLRRLPCDGLAAEWAGRLDNAVPRVAAAQLYSGRAFSLSKKVAASRRADLFVISAGMGLIPEDARIPPYSLTIAPGGPDCILKRAPRRLPFSESQWWESIRKTIPLSRSFRELLAKRPAALVVVALTSPYLRMVQDELQQLDEQTLRRVRIVGPRRRATLPASLQPLVMPYDVRLDDPAVGLGGTVFDFPARALAHFSALTRTDRGLPSPGNHARRVLESLAPLTAPIHPPGTRLSNAALVKAVSSLRNQGLSRTAALRSLRDGGLACEAHRFAAVWGGH